MTICEKIKKLEFLFEIITKEHTGNPEELARRICVSRRGLFRCLQDIKDLGFQISYCTYRRTYYFIDEKKEEEKIEKKIESWHCGASFRHSGNSIFAAK